MTAPVAPASPAASPAIRERSLAPDIARGFMLLFIALANVPLYLWGREYDAHGYIADGSWLDTALVGLENLVIAERSRPMFAILYGFGLAMMVSRIQAKAAAAGADAGASASLARRIVARRSWWLIAFGFMHAALLFMGDILASYGIAGLISLAFLTRPDRVVARWIAWSLAGVVLVSAPLIAAVEGALLGDAGFAAEAPQGDTYFSSVITGIVNDLVQTVGSGALFFYVPLIASGVLMLRRGWLTDPASHLPALRRTFAVGMAVGVASAAPATAMAMGLWEPSPLLAGVATWSTLVGGMVAGAGYVCGFALLAHRWRSHGRRGGVRALAALGERSLTGYLTQSFIMAPLLAPWGLGLGDGLGYTAAFGIAVGAWLVSIGITLALDATGRRGPFEAALRRLAYGKAQGASLQARAAARSATARG